jgi:hypothetical protein
MGRNPAFRVDTHLSFFLFICTMNQSAFPIIFPHFGDIILALVYKIFINILKYAAKQWQVHCQQTKLSLFIRNILSLSCSYVLQ